MATPNSYCLERFFSYFSLQRIIQYQRLNEHFFYYWRDRHLPVAKDYRSHLYGPMNFEVCRRASLNSCVEHALDSGIVRKERIIINNYNNNNNNYKDKKRKWYAQNSLGFWVQTDHLISARRPDLVIVNKKVNQLISRLCCPSWTKDKTGKKRDK